MYMCVEGVDFVSVSKILDWILELFRQWYCLLFIVVPPTHGSLNECFQRKVNSASALFITRTRLQPRGR